MFIAVLVVLVAQHVIVRGIIVNPNQSKGFCLTPFVFYVPLQRVFSGPIQTLGTAQRLSNSLAEVAFQSPLPTRACRQQLLERGAVRWSPDLQKLDGSTAALP